MKIKIVYFSYLLENKWEDIVIEQLDKLYSLTKLYEIADIYISVIDVSKDAIELKKLQNIIKNKYSKIEFINVYYTNEYEYPGIKSVYELSTNNDHEYILYFHSKGMTSNHHSIRTTLFDYTIANYEEAIHEFQNNKETDIVCIFPSGYGFAYYNFFWARSSYIYNYCSKPENTKEYLFYDRYTWELWLGNHYSNKKFIKTYSPVIKYDYVYDFSNAGILMEHLEHYKNEFFHLYKDINFIRFYNKHLFTLNIFSKLENICTENKSDVVINKNNIDSYLQLYNNLFTSKRYNALNVLQIGICNDKIIQLWRDYFYNANIYGVDNNDLTITNKYVLHDKHVEIFIKTDAYDYGFITEIFVENKIIFDIIIHDHNNSSLIQQISFLVKYMSLMSETGILIIENVDNANIPILHSFVPLELVKYIFIYELQNNNDNNDNNDNTKNMAFVINKN